MAIPADTVWQVDAGVGSDANGGGFSVSSKGATGTDLTLSAATSFTSTLSAVGTTSLTDSAAGFSNTMLGNVIQIAAQGLYCITGFTSSSIVTVDRNLGTFTTTSGKIGGGFISLGQVGVAGVTGNIAYVKAGTIVAVTSATNNVSGGCINLGGLKVIGYTSNRTLTNTDAKPTIQIQVNTATIFGGGSMLAQNLILDGNLGGGFTTSTGVQSSAIAFGCKFINFNSNACLGQAILCEATGCSAIPFTNVCFGCSSHGNTATGFSVYTACFDCISYNNTGGTTDGFINGGSSQQIVRCVAYNNGRDGFNIPSLLTMVVDCIAEGNARYGLNLGSSQVYKLSVNFSHYNNTSGGVNAPGNASVFNTIALSVSPFIAASSADFRLNATTGGGALLRGLGFPADWSQVGASANMLSYPDIGAAQHIDSAGSVGFVG